MYTDYFEANQPSQQVYHTDQLHCFRRWRKIFTSAILYF